MSTYWMLYWITRLDGIHELGKGLAMIGVMACVGIPMALGLADDVDISPKTRKTLGRMGRWVAVPMAVVGICILVFVPTTKEAMVIAIGGKTLNYVQADTSLQKIPEATSKLLLQYIEKAADDMKNGKR